MNRLGVELCKQLKDIVELKNLLIEDSESVVCSESEKAKLDKFITFLEQEMKNTIKDIIYAEKL